MADRQALLFSKMRQSALTIIMLILIPQLGMADREIELYTPPPFLSTVNSELHLIGRTSALIVEIRINGEKFTDLVVKDSIFHGHARFRYGLNEIEVIPVFSGKVATADEIVRVEVLCGPDVTKKYERLYPNFKFHESRPAKVCLGCHLPEIAIPLPSSGNSLCLSCHVEFPEPTASGVETKHSNCDACHKLGPELLTLTSNFGYFEESTCLVCHESRRPDSRSQYVHGPVAVGSCTTCHDPHGSRHEHSLKSSQEILCFGCHDFQREFKEMTFQHEPFERGHCNACHDPHATANKWVLMKSSETICLECHMKEGDGQASHTHPFNVKPKRKITDGLNLTTSGRLECLSCHNPHASMAVHLLRTDQEFTCAGCHADNSN